MSRSFFALAAGLAFTITGTAQQKPADPTPLVVPPPPPGGVCPQGVANLCIPLDNTFTVVQMNAAGGSGKANPADVCQRNDDDSGQYFLNGWNFLHFGTPFNEVFINNNGNLSFGVQFSTFSPVGFPVADFPMVAPFWGDVDTGDINDINFSGVVYLREDNEVGFNRLTVTWDNVGYYNEHGDLLNTFQVIITDGNDPLIGIGNNVCFCYDDMQWTTGDASGGTGGFGGSPATVGANEGNGIDFFQVGLFDHPGVDYDGPDGSTDGVSFLDNQNICFNISGVDPNVPPIFINPPGDCLEVDPCEKLDLFIQAIGPEGDQTVTLSVDDGGLEGFDCDLVPGNPATATCTFTPTPGQAGQSFNVTFTATDDGDPPLSTDLTVCINVTGNPIGENYCTDDTTPNSTGETGKLQALGSDVAADEDVLLVAYDLPPGNVCLFIGSANQGLIQPPRSCGPICLMGPDIFRFKFDAQIVGDDGKCELQIDPFNVLTNPPQPILAGQTWNFQCWHRDAGAGPDCNNNFTDAVQITFQ